MLKNYIEAKSHLQQQDFTNTQMYLHIEKTTTNSFNTEGVISLPGIIQDLVLTQYKTACEAMCTFYYNTTENDDDNILQSRVLSHMYSEYDLLSSVMNLIYNAMSSLKLEIERLKQELDICYSGKLSNYSITPALLKRSINRAYFELSTSQNWTELYYQLSHVIVHKLDNNIFRLYVLISSPVLSGTRFILYSSHFWFSHERLSYPYTEYKYLAVSEKKHFMPMKNLDNCIMRMMDNNNIICTIQR